MKSIFTILIFSFSGYTAMAQTTDIKVAVPDSTKDIQVVEASCGQCKLGLKGSGCNLAIRIKNKAYFVDGADLDTYGDAHAHDGFCNAIRKAEVQGKLVKNRFNVTYFKLLPFDKKD